VENASSLQDDAEIFEKSLLSKVFRPPAGDGHRTSPELGRVLRLPTSVSDQKPGKYFSVFRFPRPSSELQRVRALAGSHPILPSTSGYQAGSFEPLENAFTGYLSFPMFEIKN